MLNPSFNAWYSIFIFELSGITSCSNEYATGGRHLGRDKTLEKDKCRFYWRPNMWKILSPDVNNASAQMSSLISLGQFYIQYLLSQRFGSRKFCITAILI